MPIINGNNANNFLVGTPFDDTIHGFAGDDVLIGLDGNDTLDGGLGADKMQGGRGNDTYIVDNAGDVVIEAQGEGIDTVYSSVGYALSANVERLVLTGVGNIWGVGNDLVNSVIGNAGANLIDGRGGNDFIVTGLGADRVLFDTPLGVGNVDTITDLNPALDTILLDDAVFAGLPLGVLAFTAFKSGGVVDADDRIIYNPVTGDLFFDPDGSGAAMATQFATLSNLAAITNVDFVVV
jgi:Ca2+-binding RTX toxin-like protein